MQGRLEEAQLVQPPLVPARVLHARCMLPEQPGSLSCTRRLPGITGRAGKQRYNEAFLCPLQLVR
uniref:Uncharacterized protein n=1 Tax=Oryza punctata TaxID=4537 RepID=A0A0E0KQM7_ORYPU